MNGLASDCSVKSTLVSPTAKTSPSHVTTLTPKGVWVKRGNGDV